MQFQKDFLDKLKSAKHIIALTGAGMSAESGIQTFRDSNGLWNNHRIEDVASKTGLQKNPQLVWEFYQHRLNDVFKAKPNPGHEALAHLESMVTALTVITQNVDGLHQIAGNKQVIELHGSLMKWHCDSCKQNLDIDDVLVDQSDYGLCTMATKSTETICGGYIRPSVVWFGEHVLGLDQIDIPIKECDLMLIIGTSAEVSPASIFPSVVKNNNNSYIVTINPNMTWLDKIADLSLYGKSGEVLPEIISQLNASN